MRVGFEIGPEYGGDKDRGPRTTYQNARLNHQPSKLSTRYLDVEVDRKYPGGIATCELLAFSILTKTDLCCSPHHKLRTGLQQQTGSFETLRTPPIKMDRVLQ